MKIAIFCVLCQNNVQIKREQTLPRKDLHTFICSSESWGRRFGRAGQNLQQHTYPNRFTIWTFFFFHLIEINESAGKFSQLIGSILEVYRHPQWDIQQRQKAGPEYNKAWCTIFSYWRIVSKLQMWKILFKMTGWLGLFLFFFFKRHPSGVPCAFNLCYNYKQDDQSEGPHLVGIWVRKIHRACISCRECFSLALKNTWISRGWRHCVRNCGLLRLPPSLRTKVWVDLLGKY